MILVNKLILGSYILGLKLLQFLVSHLFIKENSFLSERQIRRNGYALLVCFPSLISSPKYGVKPTAVSLVQIKSPALECQKVPCSIFPRRLTGPVPLVTLVWMTNGNSESPKKVPKKVLLSCHWLGPFSPCRVSTNHVCIKCCIKRRKV